MGTDQPRHEAAPRDAMDDILDDLLTGADYDLASSLTPVLNMTAGLDAVLGHDKVPVVTGSLMANLDPADREFLINQGLRRSFLPGKLLMHQGDPTNHVLVLLSGWVRVFTTTPSGQNVLLALRGPGDVIGEQAALHGGPRAASVETLASVVVIQMTSGQFAASLRARPTMATAVIKQLSERLYEAESTRIDSATLDATRRVATYLVQLMQLHGVYEHDGLRVRIALTQQDVANGAGVSRRAVVRSIAALQRQRIVTTSRRGIVVLLPDVLDLVARAETPTHHR